MLICVVEGQIRELMKNQFIDQIHQKSRTFHVYALETVLNKVRISAEERILINNIISI